MKDKVILGFIATTILVAMLVLGLSLLPSISQDAEASGPTAVSGPISSDTTWTQANSPYIVTGAVPVSEGVTLTIEPWVVVKFNSGASLQINGQLIARGTELDPITFTSNQPSPAPGDWENILFTDSSVDATYDGEGNYTGGCIMQYCVVEYAR